MWGLENMSKGARYNMDDKIKYIESQKDVINRETADKLVKNILEQIEIEKNSTRKAMEDHKIRLSRQQELYKYYLHDQSLEAIQIMFFMNENKIAEKNYKITPFALMKNKESRKSGSDNPLSKKVCKISLDSQLLSVHDSMNQAAKDNNTFHASISKCCSKPEKMYISGGFHWCFENDLSTVLFRCRFAKTLIQLLKKIPRYNEPRKFLGRPQSEDSKKKIAESLRGFYKSDAGKKNKKQAFEKRSETITSRRERAAM